MKTFILNWISRTPHLYTIHAPNLAAAQVRQATTLAHWNANQVDVATINLDATLDIFGIWNLTYVERKQHAHEILANDMAEAQTHRVALLTSWPADRFELSTIKLEEVSDDGGAQETVRLPLPISPPYVKVFS